MSLSLFTKLFTKSHSVKGSGYNLTGQLDSNDKNLQLDVKDLKIKDVYKMDKSMYHTCYVLSNYDVYVTGQNESGQLGLGNTETVYELTKVTDLDYKVVDTKCGINFTLLLTKDNHVLSSGNNTYGQLGLKSLIDNYYTFNKIDIEDVIEIYSGGYNFFVKTKNGEVYACGRNDYGQLGLEDTDIRNRPVKVRFFENISKIESVYCGSFHTIFKLENGEVYGCGRNNYGQLGLGDKNKTSVITPQKIDITNVRTIECGDNHSIFLLNDGSVMGCGYNYYGQLGLNNNVTQYSLVQLPISNVKELSVIANSTIFLLDSDKIYGCGKNNYGELGLNDTLNRYSIVLLKYNDIWLDSLSEDIVNLPELDYNKKLYIADGYLLMSTKYFVYILDNNLILKSYRIEDMSLCDIVYFYFDNHTLKFSKEYYDFYDNNGNRLYKFIEPLYCCSDINNKDNNYITFSINGIIFRYNHETKTIKKLFESNTLCTSIVNNYAIFEDKTVLLDDNSSINNIKNILDVIETDIDNSYSYVGYNKNILYLIDKDFSNVFQYDMKEIITSIYSLNKRLFIGTKLGNLYVIRNKEELNDILVPTKRFHSEIVSLNIKNNTGELNKNFVIEDYGRFLIIGFSDGRYKKYPLYLMPDISFECEDVNFIDDKVYYHLKIEMNSEDDYYENMRLLIHNTYNSKEISINDFKDKKYVGTFDFYKSDLDLYTYIRINYLFGNNTIGSLSEKICNIKLNTMTYYLDKLTINLSNYTKNNYNIIIETVNDNNEQNSLTQELDNLSDHKFLTFNISNLKTFSIKIIDNDKEVYLLENYNVDNIRIDNTVKRISQDNNILNDFDLLFNRIYENKNTSDISLDSIVNLLNFLSHKKLEKIQSLEETSISDDVKTDIFGNSINILQNNQKHYMSILDVDKPLKSVRYRNNVYINGRKVPYNEVCNLINNNQGYFHTYFYNSKIETSNNDYVDINLYEESLINSEKELRTIRINETEDIEKLITDGYDFVVNNFSEYLDLNYLSVYINFRTNFYINRITLNDYELSIKEYGTTYTKFNLKIKNESLCRIGNVIHVVLNDLDKNNSVIFRDFSKNESKKFKNYFTPLLTLNENGSFVNYYTTKSENIDVVVNGYTLIPYVDYKVLNFPLHLQIPSIVLFRHPVEENLKIEITILKEKFIDCIIKKNDKNGSIILQNKANNNYSNFVPLLYNSYDKYVDRLKVPNIYEDGKTVDCYSNNYIDREYEYLRFYLEDNSFTRFLITLLNIKLKEESIKQPTNSGTITKENYNPNISSLSRLYKDSSSEGLLYFLIEEFDNAIIQNNNIVIDCNNLKQIYMEDDVELNSNTKFSLPYIDNDLNLNCNLDYNKDNFLNKI